MLKKEFRLKKNNEFQLILRKGKKSFTGSLIMLFAENKNELKIGYSVSKKHGKSVKRNRIKRLLRASIFDFISDIKPSVHIILIPKVSEEYNFFVFRTDIERILKKEKLLK